MIESVSLDQMWYPHHLFSQLTKGFTVWRQILHLTTTGCSLTCWLPAQLSMSYFFFSSIGAATPPIWYKVRVKVTIFPEAEAFWRCFTKYCVHGWGPRHGGGQRRSSATRCPPVRWRWWWAPPRHPETTWHREYILSSLHLRSHMMAVDWTLLGHYFVMPLNHQAKEKLISGWPPQNPHPSSPSVLRPPPNHLQSSPSVLTPVHLSVGLQQHQHLHQ